MTIIEFDKIAKQVVRDSVDYYCEAEYEMLKALYLSIFLGRYKIKEFINEKPSDNSN